VSGPLQGIVVRGPLARLTPCRPAQRINRCVVQRATRWALPAQLGVDLPDAVHAVVVTRVSRRTCVYANRITTS
jgi:hypothetical protein